MRSGGASGLGAPTAFFGMSGTPRNAGDINHDGFQDMLVNGFVAFWDLTPADVPTLRVPTVASPTAVLGIAWLDLPRAVTRLAPRRMRRP